jgi:NitT/TauT family transport system ATP-binding protein
MITLDKVDKYYGSLHKKQLHALKEISFSVDQGEFVTIIGPSGCGKTTLIKIIAGIIPFSAGEICLDGMQIKGPNPEIGMVFQESVLFPWRTVFENVLLPIDVRGFPREKYHETAMTLLNLVGLQGFEKCYPWELSGGMQQRASICRALVCDPTILLMDEPFGALDAMTREQMNVWLQDIWLKSKKTILFITHSIPEAVYLADRVILLTGRPGTVDEIISINIPRPRPLDVMNTEEYGKIVKYIREKFNSSAALD